MGQIWRASDVNTITSALQQSFIGTRLELCKVKSETKEGSVRGIPTTPTEDGKKHTTILKVYIDGAKYLPAGENWKLRLFRKSNRRGTKGFWSIVDNTPSVNAEGKPVYGTCYGFKQTYPKHTPPTWMGNGGIVQASWDLTIPESGNDLCVDIPLNQWILDSFRDFTNVGTDKDGNTIVQCSMTGTLGGHNLLGTGIYRRPEKPSYASFAFAVCDGDGNVIGGWRNTLDLGPSLKSVKVLAEGTKDAYANGLVVDNSGKVVSVDGYFRRIN